MVDMSFLAACRYISLQLEKKFCLSSFNCMLYYLRQLYISKLQSLIFYVYIVFLFSFCDVLLLQLFCLFIITPLRQHSNTKSYKTHKKIIGVHYKNTNMIITSMIFTSIRITGSIEKKNKENKS